MDELKEKIKKKKKLKKRKKRRREIIYSIVIIIILAAGGLYFYQSARKSNPPKKKPATPASAPSQSQTVAQNPAQVFFATNGKSTVYKVKRDNKWEVIWNGRTSQGYDYVSNPVFSPDGTQFAYNAEIGNQSYVIVDNIQQISAYQKADNIVFSQNNQTVAFLAAQNNNSYVVITSPVTNSNTSTSTQNTTQSQPIAQPGTLATATGQTTSIVVSSDGTQVAYATQNGDQTTVTVNGQTSASYDSVSDFSFNSNGTYSYQAQSGSETVTVVDNQVTSAASSTSPSTSSTSSTTGTSSTTSATSTSTSSVSSSSNASSPFYQYRYISGQDVDMSPTRLGYTSCPSGNCEP